MPKTDLRTAARKAYVVTGPTSGIGLLAALELARHGTVILVGRDRAKLEDMQARIARNGGQTVPVHCDLSDVVNARRRRSRRSISPSPACSTMQACARAARRKARKAGT